MSSRVRFALTVAATTAIALVIVAVPIMLRSDETPAPAPEPTPTLRPGIVAKGHDLRTVPDVSAERRNTVGKQLGKALRGLYTRAFVVGGAPVSTASPRPGPADRVKPLLTTAARVALKASPDVFDDVDGLSVRSGEVTFEGVVTFEGPRAVEALLKIDFGGQAAPAGYSAPLVKVRQIGTVLFKNTEKGWRVDGFDLRLSTRPWNTPTPGPA